MKPTQKPKKKPDPMAEKREKGFNVYFQGANKNFADELNHIKKQDEVKLKRYQSRNKTEKHRDSIASNHASQLPAKSNKWTSKNRTIDNPVRSPPTVSSRLNNRVKEGEVSKDISKIIRAAGAGRGAQPAEAEPEGVQGEPGRSDLQAADEQRGLTRSK